MKRLSTTLVTVQKNSAGGLSGGDEKKGALVSPRNAADASVTVRRYFEGPSIFFHRLLFRPTGQGVLGQKPLDHR